MIADAAAAAGAAGAGTVTGGGAVEGTTARDRARAARAQSHAERALLELVKDLVGSFLADSFGLPSFARVLRVFLRTGFPAAARRVVWKELGDVGLLHLLDPSSNAAAATAAPSSTCVSGDGGGGGGGGGSGRDVYADDAYLCPADVDGAIVEAYLAALDHPRFGPAFATCAESQRSSSLEDRNEAAEGDSARSTGAAPSVAAAAAAAGEVVHGDRGDRSSTTGGLSMREVAVHHVACYLFSPPPAASSPPPLASADSTTLSPREDTKDKEGGTLWRPDFARRKMFERLLRQHRENIGGGRGSAGSVLAAVLGYECPGSAPGDVASAGDYAAGGGEGRRRRGVKGLLCSTRSKLGARRRELLQAYCRASGGQGDGSIVPVVAGTTGDRDAEGGGRSGIGDMAAWFDEEREINETAERLARAMLKG